MTTQVNTFGLFGIEPYKITVEADISRGLPVFEIVGLPGQAVKESANRIRSALQNTGLEFPKARLLMNLAPADIQKDSPSLDMALFVALCAVCEYCPVPDNAAAFIGELSLSGKFDKLTGALAFSASALNLGITKLFVPASKALEAAVIPGVSVYPVENTAALVAHLKGEKAITPIINTDYIYDESLYNKMPDFAEVRGQSHAKRALEIAAAGGHNLVMVGPPGSGKSMLAKRFPSILPLLSKDEAVEVTKIYSVAGLSKNGLIKLPPFRSPHHTVSPVGLSGGGRAPRPGEISLSHKGVLFLDEWPEFSKATLEILRQPLEDKTITISRATGTQTFPADFVLLASMNPCKCGNLGSPIPCRCTPKERRQYLSHISGPLLDRIDMLISVPAVPLNELESTDFKGENSATIRQRVVAARKLAALRLAPYGIKTNSQMSHNVILQTCPLTQKAKDFLAYSFEKYKLTARSYDRVLKVARTVADLSGAEVIDEGIIAEVLSYKMFEKHLFMPF